MQQYSHWHYILGYLIVLSAHNWPVFVSLGMSIYAAWQLYRTPTRAHVQRLYGWALLVFAYEYAKHLSEELSRPVVFLFTTDWAWMQPVGVALVIYVPLTLTLLLALVLLLRSLGAPPWLRGGGTSRPADVRDDHSRIRE